jgi:enoyl-[acyl-carrier-protein] reductase (NADH)
VTEQFKGLDILFVGSPRDGGYSLASAMQVAERDGNVHFAGAHPRMFERAFQKDNTYSSLERAFLSEKGITTKDNIHSCDVLRSDEMQQCCEGLKKTIGKIDGIVYAPAYAPKSLFVPEPPYPEEDLKKALDISCHGLFNLLEIGREEGLWSEGLGVVYYTFLADRELTPHYGAMHDVKAELVKRAEAAALEAEGGMRINGVTTGPVLTRSSGEIPGIEEMLPIWNMRAPLGWPAESKEGVGQILHAIGEATCFLLTAKFVTGAIIPVTGGQELFARAA